MKQVRNDWLGLFNFIETNISASMPSPLKLITKDFVDLNIAKANSLYVELLQGDFDDTDSCSLAVTFHFALIKQDPLEWLDSFNTFIDLNKTLGQNASVCNVLNFDIVTFEDGKRRLDIETDVII